MMARDRILPPLEQRVGGCRICPLCDKGFEVQCRHPSGQRVAPTAYYDTDPRPGCPPVSPDACPLRGAPLLLRLDLDKGQPLSVDERRISGCRDCPLCHKGMGPNPQCRHPEGFDVEPVDYYFPDGPPRWRPLPEPAPPDCPLKHAPLLLRIA